MNLSAVASSSRVSAEDPISMVILRKSLDQQQALASQMIASLPPPAALPDPAGTLGQSIDIYA
ncbi:putative motility protein [Zoogloea sp.]|uniref:putative motility protein n=1 Tax=Zoogloea sp. TaxID=49181 RepID=UPI001A520F46|nr:putative motility protein [Zoogloea sp.]